MVDYWSCGVSVVVDRGLFATAMIITCPQCGCQVDKRAGEVNRAKAAGRTLYCGRECAGLARRHDTRTPEQKKADKAAYDTNYRAKNREMLKAKKAAYYAENHDREKERATRQKRMPQHLEYCRRPEYRAKKKVYDRQYRAEKFYGELAEAFVLTLEIRDAALEKAGGDYELRLMKGTLSKSQKRRRDYERLNRKEPEVGTLGNLERRERR